MRLNVNPRRRTGRLGKALRFVFYGTLLLSCAAPGIGSPPTATAVTTTVVTSSPSSSSPNGIGPHYSLARERREEPPTSWAGAARTPQFEFVVLGSGDDITDVARLETGNSTSDISLGESVISVATCCEPAAGNILVFDDEGNEQRGDQGVQLDQFGDVMARIDGSSGFVLAWPEWPHRGIDFIVVPGVENNFAAGSRTIDIAIFAVDPLGIAILRATGNEFVLTKFWGGATSDTTLPDGRWCHLLGLAEGQFALLADLDQDQFSCHNSEGISIVDFDGRLVSSFTLEESAVQANSDASGTFIAYVTPAGKILWVSPDGRMGAIDSSETYLAVDW